MPIRTHYTFTTNAPRRGRPRLDAVVVGEIAHGASVSVVGLPHEDYDGQRESFIARGRVTALPDGGFEVAIAPRCVVLHSEANGEDPETAEENRRAGERAALLTDDGTVHVVWDD